MTPGYTLYAADTRTGRVAYELPAATATWSSTLNTIGTLQATLVLESVLGALSGQDERDPRVTLYGMLTGGWRYSLVLAYGGVPIWAGPYKKATRDLATATQITVAADEILTLFGKRIAITGATYTGVTLPWIMQQHLTAATTGAGFELPINSVSTTNPAGLDSRVYLGYDLKPYGQEMADLIASVNGPDLRFDPIFVPGSDANYLAYNVQIGSPYVGQTTTPWAWDAGVTAQLGWDADCATMANQLYTPGSGSGVDKYIGQASDQTLVGLGFPVLQDVDTTHSAEGNRATLDSYAAAGLTARSTPAEQWTVKVQASGDPPLGSYRPGDAVALDIRGDALHPDGTYRRRITGISGDLSDYVTLAVAAPPSGF